MVPAPAVQAFTAMYSFKEGTTSHHQTRPEFRDVRNFEVGRKETANAVTARADNEETRD